MAKKQDACKHIEEAKWIEWDRDQVTAEAAENPQYKGARVVKAKLCSLCGDMVRQKVIYEK